MVSDLKSKLQASKAAAVAAKDEFASQYVLGRLDAAVGLGLNRAHDDWAVKVFLNSESDAAGVPDHFGDFEVDVEVSGPARAY